MFDESNEPTDIFEGVDPVDNSAPPGGGKPNLGSVSAEVKVVRSAPPRWLFVLIPLVALAALGGGYYFVMRGADETDVSGDKPDAVMEEGDSMNMDSGDAAEPAMPSGDASDTDLMPPEVPANGDVTDEPSMPGTEPSTLGDDLSDSPTEPAATQTTEPSAPEAPEPVTPPVIDSDGDGLSDEDEAVMATDVVNPDTDADGLNDGEEVNIYGTDPLKPDTDGDSYLDGEEVKGGYNPNGEGRLLDVPSAQ